MTGGFKRYSPVQANYKNKFIMEKRVLAVKTAQQAFALMKSMLVANMVDNELVEKNREVGDEAVAGDVYDDNVKDWYHLKLVWLKRGDDDLVGCPCFVCPFNGTLPDGTKVDTQVYVKAFSTKALHNCKMHLNGELEWTEIRDGEEFTMSDEAGRFSEERFVYRGGEILKL